MSDAMILFLSINGSIGFLASIGLLSCFMEGSLTNENKKYKFKWEKKKRKPILNMFLGFAACLVPVINIVWTILIWLSAGTAINIHKLLSIFNLTEPTLKEILNKPEKSKETIKKELQISKELDRSDEALIIKANTLLVKLKQQSPSAYLKLTKEYEKLAKEGNLTGLTLKNLIARIEVCLETELRNTSDIIKYLDFWIVIYENNFINKNGKLTELDFNNLENLTKKIVENSKNYSKEDKVIIYKKISLLYIYELYENKDKLNIISIKNSYFNHGAFLDSAYLNILELRNKRIIEDNLLFNMEEDCTLENILKLIKEIKFNQKKNIKIEKEEEKGMTMGGH